MLILLYVIYFGWSGVLWNELFNLIVLFVRKLDNINNRIVVIDVNMIICVWEKEKYEFLVMFVKYGGNKFLFIKVF